MLNYYQTTIPRKLKLFKPAVIIILIIKYKKYKFSNINKSLINYLYKIITLH